jgi:hypothetical protein
MNDFRQPWRRVEIGGRRCLLQIVDPETAFELEPELISLLGDTLALFLAAPEHVISGALRSAISPDADLLDEEPSQSTHTAAAIVALGQVLAKCIESAKPKPAWMVRTFERLVFKRFRIGDEYIDTRRDWTRAKFGPVAKWQVFAAQIQQSFGPLWTRSPYKLRVKNPDYGVPQPPGVAVAVRYASELAKAGCASSVQEILSEWTPVRMIEITETQVYAIENERRAHEAAKSGGA